MMLFMEDKKKEAAVILGLLGISLIPMIKPPTPPTEKVSVEIVEVR